jgi:hypothetical protein
MPKIHSEALILGFLILSPSIVASKEKSPLSVANVIETRRVITGLGKPVLISPDQRRFVIVLLQGDLRRNGNWIDILCGSPLSMEAAMPRTVLRLFTKSTAESTKLVQDLRWLPDSDRLAFLWDDGKTPAHLVTLSVSTGTMKTVAQGQTPIVQYDFSENGNVAVYTARKIPDESALARLRRGGFAVGDQPIWSFLASRPDDVSWMGGYDTFVISFQHAHVRKRKVVEPDKRANIEPELLTVSPEGRHAMAVCSAPEAPTEWDLYTEHVFKDSFLPAVRKHPEGPSAIRQYQLIEIESGKSRLLWDAPENPYGSVIWSPDGLSVAVGPTFLPAKNSDADGLAGRAVAVVDLKSGNFKRLPVPRDHAEHGYRPVLWNKDGRIGLGYADFWRDDTVKLAVRNIAGEWRQVSEEQLEKHPTQVRIELREDPNTPPRLFAMCVKGSQERMILDVNPELQGRRLGHVETVHWTARDGKPWTGMLYYPVHFTPDKRFPLVIQTHGYSSRKFSLEGAGALTTAYAAQPLANADIAVLQVGGPDSAEWWAQDGATPREPQTAMAGYLGAIDQLWSTGMVDKDKVGLLGFSRTGWHVEYALTHSIFPFAAAIAADNMNPGYFEYLLGQNDYRSEVEADLGSAPFGKGLETFMREAPGFNVDKIQTPLRIELDQGPMSTSVLAKWELFSLLKYLGKPVELFLIPDIEHGAHLLQNPAQRLASLSGTVDWFSFWLKGEEDPDPAKKEQYIRWRVLRSQQLEGERAFAER